MKNIKIRPSNLTMQSRLTMYVLITLTLTACQKYLDIKPINTTKYIETAGDCQRILDNYGIMNTNYPSDGEASADNYYLKFDQYNQISDLEDRGVYTWNNTMVRASGASQWTPSYFRVYSTNLILEALNKLKGNADQTTLSGIKGATLFLRAYSYWQLAQLYAKPYNAASANSDLGISLRSTSDINEKSIRSTLQQTYDRITQDLQEATTLLDPATLASKASRPNKASAYAMLARVYLSMENYDQALINADAAIQLKSSSPNNGLLNYNTLDVNSATPFVRFNTEVLFQSIMIGSSLLEPGYGYGNGAIISPELISLYSSNDLRKLIFFKQNISDQDYTTPTGNYRFSGNYEESSGSNLFSGLAVDELYLTRAECYARSGNTAAALADLNTLLINRWKTGTYVNMTNSDPATDTPDEVLAKVLEERRKELIMRGQRWTDLRRLNKDPRFRKDLSRTLTNTNVTPNVTTTYTLPANDPRYVLLIPQDVIQNGGYQQNPRN